MPRCIAVLILLLLSANSYGKGEGQVIDSLKVILTKKDSSEKEITRQLIKEYGKRAAYDSVKSYLKILNKFALLPDDKIFTRYHLATSYFTAFPDSAELYYKQSYKLSKEYGINDYTCYTLLSLGALYHLKGEDSLSISLYEQAILLADSLIDKKYKIDDFKVFKNKCRLNMSAIFIEDGMYEKSNALILLGIKEARELKNDGLLARFLITSINNNMAWINSTSGIIKEKILVEIELNYREGMELCKKMENEWLESYLLSAKYQLLYNDNQFDSALIYIKKAYDINKKSEDHENMIIRGSRIARCYGQLNQKDSALYYADISIQIAKDHNIIDDLFDALIAKAELLDILGLNKKAILFMKSLLLELDKMTNPQKERLLSLFKSVLIKESEFQEALFIDSILQNTVDSMQLESQFKAIEDLKEKYKTREKQAQIEILELQESQNQKKLKQQQIILLLGSILGLLFTVLGFYIYRISKLRQREQTLLLQHKILRTQINPHFFFNVLQALQFQLITQNVQKETIQQLAILSKLMRKILNFSTEEKVGLRDELDLIEDYVNTQKIRLNYELDLLINCSQEILQNDYNVPPLITQPLVENCIEHAFKSKDHATITILVHSTVDDLIIEIRDNGISFNPDEVLEDSKGISIIRDRLAIISRKYRHNSGLDYKRHIPDENNEGGMSAIITIPKI